MFVVEPRGLSEQELDTWKKFLLVGTVLNRRIEQQLKNDAGLSHSQYEVLTRLSAAPGNELRMTELAGISKTSKSGLTYQVDQLEKSGLVRRTASRSDDRVVFACLTSKGRQVLEDTAPAHAALVLRLFIDGLTEHRFAELSIAINAIHDHIIADE